MFGLRCSGVVTLLRGRTASFHKKRLYHHLGPVASLRGVGACRRRATTTCAQVIRGKHVSFNSTTPIRRSVGHLRVNNSLDDARLLHVSHLLMGTTEIGTCKERSARRSTYSYLSRCFGLLRPLAPLSGRVSHYVVNRSRCDSSTDSALGRVHQDVGGVGSGMRTALAALIGNSLHACLRSTVVAVHKSHCYMPIGTRCHKRMRKLVRSRSSANSALFVRPVTVMGLGGSLGRLCTGRRRRVRIVLTGLDRRTTRCVRRVHISCHSLASLSFVFTQNTLTVSVHSDQPLLGRRKHVHVHRKHRPLLSPGGIIPVAIALKRSFALLVVAKPGANNGAISLGAINLFYLVKRSKLRVPTKSHDRLTMFRRVCTSVKSRRDVRRDLDAFSSRVAGVISFLGGMSRHSLILFSRLKTNASPARNTTLTVSVLSRLRRENVHAVTAARCDRLGICTLSAPNIRGTYYRFSMRDLHPACHLLVNVPNGDGTFTVSKGLNLPSCVVRSTGGQLDRRSISFRSLLASLRADGQAVRGRRRRVTQLGGRTRSLGTRTGRHRRGLSSRHSHVLHRTGRGTGTVLHRTGRITSGAVGSFHGFNGRGVSTTRVRGRHRGLHGGVGSATSTSTVGTRGPGGRRGTSSFGLKRSIGILDVGLAKAMDSLPSTGKGLAMHVKVLDSRIGVSSLRVVRRISPCTPGGVGHASGNGVGVKGSLSIQPRVGLLKHAISRTITRLSGCLSSTVLTRLGAIHMIRKGKAKTLEGKVRRCLHHRGRMGSCRLTRFNRNSTNMAVMRLNWLFWAIVGCLVVIGKKGGGI